MKNQAINACFRYLGFIVAASTFTNNILLAQSTVTTDAAAAEIEFESDLQQQIDLLRTEVADLRTARSKKSSQDYPQVRVTGFFHLDTGYFDQSPNSINQLGDIDDGSGFRRARVAAAGDLNDRVSFITEFDFAQSQARIVDVWGQINDTRFGNIRIGRYRQPFGMSELTSIRELPFLERPSFGALNPFRQTGIMFFDQALSEQATWAFSGFRTFSDNFGNVVGDNGGYGTALRTTLMKGSNETSVVHGGFGHSFLDPGRDQLIFAGPNEIFLSQQPNFGPTGLSVLPLVGVPPFFNTGAFTLDHANLYNVELAWSLGRSLIQGEYRWGQIQLPTESASVHGGYLLWRYMLTGERIPYKKSAGVFGRVIPKNPLNPACGQWGAWELATRISLIDVSDLFGRAGVLGPTREMAITTIGLNWYWWKNAKCQFQVSHTDLTDPTSGTSSANTYASRVQFDF